MSRSYNGGIASYAIWLPELTKFIELYQSGCSIDDINQMSDEETIFWLEVSSNGKIFKTDSDNALTLTARFLEHLLARAFVGIWKTFSSSLIWLLSLI